MVSQLVWIALRGLIVSDLDRSSFVVLIFGVLFVLFPVFLLFFFASCDLLLTGLGEFELLKLSKKKLKIHVL